MCHYMRKTLGIQRGRLFGKNYIIMNNRLVSQGLVLICHELAAHLHTKNIL